MNFTNNMECMVDAKSCFKLGTFILELTPGEKPKTKQQNQETFPPLANACLSSRSPTNRPRSGASWIASHGKCDPRGLSNVKPEPSADAGPRVWEPASSAMVSRPRSTGSFSPSAWAPRPAGLRPALSLGPRPCPRRSPLDDAPVQAATARRGGRHRLRHGSGRLQSGSERAAPVPSVVFTLELGRAGDARARGTLPPGKRMLGPCPAARGAG